MCSKFGVLMFEVFDVRYFGVRSKTTIYFAIVLIPNLPPAENDFCLHCLQSTLLLLPYIIGIYGLRYSMLYVCILCTYVTYNFGS